MMNRHLFKILLFLGLAIVHPSEVMSQTVLRLATVENFPPFSYEENGKLTGVAIDVVYEMAKRLKINVKIKAYPWSRVLKSIEEGFVDGGFAVFEKEERKAFCLYTGVIQYEEYHVFVKKGKEFPFTGINDLYGKTIGIDRGVFVSQAFEQAVKERKINLEEVNDMLMLNVKKVCEGRIDALIGDSGVIPYYAKVSGLAGMLVSLGPVHEKQASYLVLSKNSKLPNKPELQQKITKVLKTIWEDGTYQQISNRYHEFKQ